MHCGEGNGECGGMRAMWGVSFRARLGSCWDYLLLGLSTDGFGRKLVEVCGKFAVWVVVTLCHEMANMTSG